MRLSQAIQKKIKKFNSQMNNGDVDIDLKYVPNEKQKLLHESVTPVVLYGGAVGGGKSAALVVDSTMYALENPGSICWLFRKTRSSAIKVFLNDGFYKFVPTELWNYHEGNLGPTIEFINGSVIYLCSMDVDRDKDKYLGERCQYLGIDEVTLFKSEHVNFLQSRCRSEERQDGQKFPRKVRYTANPGGPSHAYIKRLFIDRAFEDGEDPTMYGYIFSSLMDNKYLMADKEYTKALLGMPEAMRRRYLEGDWGIGDGVFLDQFDPRISMCVPFEIPKTWKRYRALDYGYGDKTVVGWFAISPSGVHYLYREMVFTKTVVEDMARQILSASGDENIICTFADPSVFAARPIIKDPTFRSPGLVFAKCGLILSPGNNDRLYGGMMVREYLTPTEVILDASGTIVQRTKLQIFSTCKETLDSVPHLVCDPNNPDDIQHGSGKKQNDHSFDMLRYYLTSVSGGTVGYADNDYAHLVKVNQARANFEEDKLWNKYFNKRDAQNRPKTIEGLMNSNKSFDKLIPVIDTRLKNLINHHGKRNNLY